MDLRSFIVPLTLFTLGSTALIATEARADILEACGGVYFETLAEGSCELVPAQECTSVCEPVATVKVCAANLQIECEGECMASATVECESSCSEICVPECETTAESNPPDCMGLCMSNCQMDCTAACDGVDDHGQCRSGCAQTCADGCHDQCDDHSETTCEPVCSTACQGSCEARANIDCQLACQGEAFPACETQVTEECREECETTGAAIFCEGQFLATAGDLEACAAELTRQFGFMLDVTVDADGEAECEDGNCEGEGELESEASLGCWSTVDRDGARGAGWASLLLLLGLSGVARRRWA